MFILINIKTNVSVKSIRKINKDYYRCFLLDFQMRKCVANTKGLRVRVYLFSGPK